MQNRPPRTEIWWLGSTTVGSVLNKNPKVVGVPSLNADIPPPELPQAGPGPAEVGGSGRALKRKVWRRRRHQQRQAGDRRQPHLQIRSWRRTWTSL
mmetsp:Transcript_164218/g.526655  ORF Transcript_164218/g.526655 Transcript_164218/m.526655 type:complete len:96 (+) Transcript_164218:497-784(+)